MINDKRVKLRKMHARRELPCAHEMLSSAGLVCNVYYAITRDKVHEEPQSGRHSSPVCSDESDSESSRNPGWVAPISHVSTFHTPILTVPTRLSVVAGRSS